MSFDWWPPNGPWDATPGGIRGPDHRTMTDLHNLMVLSNSALATIVLQLAGMNDNLSSIAAAVNRLAGPSASDPGDWEGLAHYLWGVVGGLPFGGGGSTLLGELLLARPAVEAIRQALADNGVDQGEDALGLTLAAFLAEADNRATARFNIGSIQAALGSLGTTPADMTVKALLEQIRLEAARTADCCEEVGPTEPPPNTENAEPTGIGCSGPIDWLRCVGWAQAQTPIDMGGEDFDAYVPLFGDIGAWSDDEFFYDCDVASGFDYCAFYHPTITWRVCLKWDFTDNYVPAILHYARWDSVDFQTVPPTSTAASPFVVPVGSYQDILSNNVRLTPVFQFSPGEGPPGNNVWLGIQYVPS